MILIDDRNDNQKQSHKWGIVAHDKFMSGWGGAKGGTSRVAWAVQSMQDAEKVLAKVRARTEMIRVNLVNLDKYRAPKNTAHFHIYVVGETHPYLS